MNRFKYARTYHFPFSKGLGNDDKMKTSFASFLNQEVVVTIKMDGENSSLYSDGYTHARSMDSKSHESRDWLKKFWASRYFNLPTGWRVVGENLYAKHSIEYNNLTSYFQAFAIFDENNKRLHWNDFEYYCKELDIEFVNVVDRFTFDDTSFKRCEELFNHVVKDGHEGIVVTTVNGFLYDDHSEHLAKAVRENHVQSDQHWSQNWIKNNLAQQ